VPVREAFVPNTPKPGVFLRVFAGVRGMYRTYITYEAEQFT